MTIREMVKAMQREVRESPDLQPDRAAVLLTQLSAVLGNILDEIREADLAYAVVLLAHLESDKTANRARIRAETSPEYQRRREARDTKEVAVEMVRALKYFLKAKQDEYQAARHL